jgi:hypothetical protein
MPLPVRPIAAAGLRALFAASLVAACIAPALGQLAPVTEAPRAIAIQAQPVDSFDLTDASRIRFGALEFRGGLVLTSDDKTFGGLSGLRLTPDGSGLLALSDKGRWFRGTLVYRDGRPAGIADAETAPILGADGTPLAMRGWYDTEALAQDGTTLYVGIERVNEIVRFDYGRDGLLSRGVRVAAPLAVKTLPFNKGIEALAFVPRAPTTPLAGTLIAISERGLDAAGNILGFLIGGPRPGMFTVRRSGEFDVSDADILPGGDLVLLERSFAPLRGVGLRIRRVRQSAIRPGAVLDGAVLVEADMGYQIDNMEGVAVHRNAQGETILTLISDDNFSPLQRTLLLQFALVGE